MASVTTVAPPPKPRPRGRSTGWRPGKTTLVLTVCAIPVVTLGTWLYHFYGRNNLHTMIPGEVYRSSQMSPRDLEQTIKQHGIRTVVNLRGACTWMPWYQQEAETTQRMDVGLEDLWFSAGRLPSRTEMLHMLEVLEHAERPLLIHCRRGADRTGLMCAVIKLLRDDGSLAAARRQLSVLYGHIPVGKTKRMHGFFDRYENWLQQRDYKHSPTKFRHWVRHVYRAGRDCEFELCELTDTPIRAGEPFAIKVQVRNTGDKTWRFRPNVTAGHHLIYILREITGKELVRGRGGLFRKDVAPGESIEMLLPVAPIKRAGRYYIIVDMMEEGMGSFFQLGSEPVELRLDVQ